MYAKCVPASKNAILSINVVLHMLFLFTFLTVFFIVVISRMMKNAFENEITQLIESNVNTQLDKIDKEQEKLVITALEHMPLDKFKKKYMQHSDVVEQKNKQVKNIAISTIVIGISVLILILYILSKTCNKCIPIKELIIENIIVFTFVGIVEYIFFTQVAFKFIPAPPSLLLTSFIEKFKSSVVSYA